MLLYAFGIWVFFMLLVLRAGWMHQARKTPEERHLDFLIDANDPYATAYAHKIFCMPTWQIIDNDTGKIYALI